MLKDLFNLKSLILPAIILFCLLAGRKYVLETGIGKIPLLPNDENRLCFFDEEIQYKAALLQQSSDELFKKLQNSKIQDSTQIGTTITKLHIETEKRYTLIHKIRSELTTKTGGHNRIGGYIGVFKRIKYETKTANDLYMSLLNLQFKFQSDSLLEVLDFAFQTVPLNIITNNRRGRQIDIDEFSELYCDAPLIILLINLSRFELSVAKLEYYALLHIAKKNKIEVKHL